MAHAIVVLDDEEPLAVASHRRRVVARDPLLGAAGLRRPWEQQPHRRPLSRRAVDLDAAARLLREAIDHAETEAGALAALLGGEERLEHLVADLRRHAGPSVGDGYDDEVAFA